MSLLVLFDVDGTLVKFKSGISKKILGTILKEIFNKEIPETTMPSFAGMTDLQIIREICEANDISFEDLKPEINLLWENMLNVFRKFATPEHIELLPGVSDLLFKLSELDSIQLALLTGNFKKNAYLKLSTYALDKYFPVGSFGSDHEDRNQLPSLAIKRANILKGVKAFSAKNTLIIGDAPRDIICAKANKIKVISVATGTFTKVELLQYHPDYIFDSFVYFDEVISKITSYDRKN